MNQSMLEEIVKEVSNKSDCSDGVVEFSYKNMDMYCISDVHHDRMRIISPIAKYSSLSKDEIDIMMISNFHLALDARYATSENVLYSAFIHPLSSLTEQQIISAVEQVYNLASSFGSEYSSGILNYGGH